VRIAIPGRPSRIALALTAAALVLACLAPAAAQAQAAAPATAAAFDPEARLRALGLQLPVADPPIANYVRAVRTGNLVFLAGHGECGTSLKGKLGAGITIDSAYASARRVGLCLLSSLKAEVGDLRRVRRVVRVVGMVNATPDFTDHPKVVNGVSDLLVQVFGERGRHARAAVGMGSLPNGMTVEVEMIVEVDP
jgi:enamine deaminase RidA (YjgF/YER057c/UK114 family)